MSAAAEAEPKISEEEKKASGEKRKDDSGDAETQNKRQKGHGGASNIPAHRGAFKRHLRKHTLLFQREKGETSPAFVVSCDQGKEARAVQSSVELIKLALSKIPGKEETDKEGEDTWVCDPGCNGVVCVTIERKGIDPAVQLLPALWEHVRELGQRSKAELKKFINVHKFIYRFIPLQVMCRATMVACEVRSCSSLNKKTIIDKVAGMVKGNHKVQLYMPETLIVIQVLKSASGISVVPNASRYCKSQKSSFNLMQFANSLLEPEETTPSAKPESSDPKASEVKAESKGAEGTSKVHEKVPEKADGGS